MKLRKITAAVLSLSLVCGAVPFSNVYKNDTAVFAEEETEYTEGNYGYLTYINYGDYIEISDCDESATSVEIPSDIDGVPVTTIGGYAFADCENLETIIFPESIADIGEGAFYGTRWLIQKRIENPLIIINNILVDGVDCTGNIVVPEGITEIPNDVFFIGPVGGYVGGDAPEGANITSVHIPDSVTKIGYKAFCYCKQLTEVVVPENVGYLGDSVFLGCESLRSVVVLNPECELDFTLYDGLYDLTFYGYEGSMFQSAVESACDRWNAYFGEPPVRFAPISDLYGDIDTDGEVNSSDASSVLAEYAKTATGGENSFSQVQTIAADVNKDGAVDSSDASSILAYYAYTATGGEGTLEDFLS
mgnify:CR=1 FL=1